MALIIEAPNEVYSIANNENIKLFLAGGISNCPNWQQYVVKELEEVNDLSIYNPRRKTFDLLDKKLNEEQVSWEFNNLSNSDIICFWFSSGSINPITLYELGYNNQSSSIIIIGIDPDYERKDDIILQTRLARPEVFIHDNLDDFIHDIKETVNIMNDFNNE